MSLFFGFFAGVLLLVVLGVPRQVMPWLVCLTFVMLAVTGAID